MSLRCWAGLRAAAWYAQDELMNHIPECKGRAAVRTSQCAKGFKEIESAGPGPATFTDQFDAPSSCARILSRNRSQANVFAPLGMPIQRDSILSGLRLNDRPYLRREDCL
jgi:hypothetical protein